MSQNHKNEKKQKITSKQAVAMAGVALLVLLYLVTLIVAIFDTSAAGSLFQACLVATVAIPLLLWIYIALYGRLTQKSTMADLNIGGISDEDKQA